MKKADLKDFQVVVLRNGQKGVVVLKHKESRLPAGLREEFGVRTTEFAILYENCVLVESEYKNNLKHRCSRRLDIMEVYGDETIRSLSEILDTDKLKCVYKRKEKNLKKLLSTGCMVSTRQGIDYLVIKDCDTENYGSQEFCLVRSGGFVCGSDYNKSLYNTSSPGFDIIKIYGKGYIDSNSLNVNVACEDVIWER